MSRNIDHTTLGYLGVEFQLKLVKCFFEDHKFFTSIQDIVDQNMFTNEHLRRIVGFMKDRFALNETVTTYFEMETIIRSKVSDAISVEQLISLLNRIGEMDLVGMDLVEEESGRFFKQQNLTKAINNAQEIIRKGDIGRYDDIEDIIKKALETNTKQEMGFRVFDDMEQTLSEHYRSYIPTGADKLDEALYGGLGKGELGVIVAPSGIGKTSATTGFAAAAATTKAEDNNYRGYKVLHFFFEGSDVSIKRKYYGFVTGFDASDLHLPNVRPYVIDMLNKNPETKQMIQDNIIVEHLRSGEVSASDIKNKVRRYIARGFKPDLIIIDYFECIKFEKSGSSGDSEWSKEGVTMRKLEAMAEEFDIALWVPVQGTKDSLGVEFVGLAQAGGSVKKTQIAHVIITLAQTDEMKTKGKMNLFIGKFRAGKMLRNKFFNIDFNHGTCRFDMGNVGNDDEEEIFDNYNGDANIANEIAKRTLLQQKARKN